MVQESVQIIQSLKTKEASIELRSDGIVRVLFNENITIDIPEQMKLMDNYRTILKDKKYPFLYEAMNNVNFTKEARENAIKIEDESPVFASAALAETLPYLLIGNFYMRFNKPKTPFKLFRNREKAIKWLLEQKAKYEKNKGLI